MQFTRNPKFIIYAGPMFSGKTERLLFDVNRASFRKKKVVLFKPKIDTRYSKDNVVSHFGKSLPAIEIDKASDIEAYIKNNPLTDLIAVDEAFMVNDISSVLIGLYLKKYNIVISTLDLDYKMEPMLEYTKMAPYATELVKCCSCCDICGEDAFYTYKNAKNNLTLEVGGKELYSPRCLSHFSIIN